MVSKLWVVIKPLLPWIIAIAVVLGAGAWLGSLYTASRMQDDIQTANAATANVQHQFDTYKTDVATKDAERKNSINSSLSNRLRSPKHTAIRLMRWRHSCLRKTTS
jgi:hypothetical protein